MNGLKTDKNVHRNVVVETLGDVSTSTSILVCRLCMILYHSQQSYKSIARRQKYVG
jgi:hypothetical protein